MTSPLACVGAAPAPTVQQFAFCFTTASTAVVPNVNYFTSVTVGTITANLTVNGIWTVSSITGYRTVASLGATSGTASNVAISGLTPFTSCNGCDNLLYFPPQSFGYADSGGVSFTLQQAQSDFTGCSGSYITMRSYNTSVCGSGSQPGPNSLIVVPYNNGIAPSLSCSIPTNPILETEPRCGVGMNDLSSLSYGPDLSITMGEYTIYMRLCGAVTQPDCVATFGSNVQICQWSSSTVQYEISSYLAPFGETVWSYVNGVDGSAGFAFNITDGQTCNPAAPYPRQALGVITCGSITNITFYEETSTPCIYQFNLTSPLACVGSSSTAVSIPLVSSSSSVTIGSLGCSITQSPPAGSIFVSVYLNANLLTLYQAYGSTFGPRFITVVANTIGLSTTVAASIIQCSGVEDSMGAIYTVNNVPPAGQIEVNFYFMNDATNGYSAFTLYNELTNNMATFNTLLVSSLGISYGNMIMSTTVSSNDSGGRGLTGGAIAGIVIGIVIGVGLICIILFFAVRYRSSLKSKLTFNGNVVSSVGMQGAYTEQDQEISAVEVSSHRVDESAIEMTTMTIEPVDLVEPVEATYRREIEQAYPEEETA